MLGRWSEVAIGLLLEVCASCWWSTARCVHTTVHHEESELVKRTRLVRGRWAGWLRRLRVEVLVTDASVVTRRGDVSGDGGARAERLRRRTALQVFCLPHFSLVTATLALVT